MISTFQDIGIYSVVDPFRFTKSSNQQFYQDTLSVFCSLLQQKWEMLKETQFSPSALDSMRELLVHSSDTQLDSFLLQPEISNRLLRQSMYPPGYTETFFLQALSAHRAKETHSYDQRLAPRLWSANGDYLISFNEETGDFDEFEAPKVGGTVPIDFFSPYCQSLSQEDIQESPDTVFDLYTMEEAENVFEHMDNAVQPLAGNPNFYELVCLFNNVVMVKKQINSNRFGRRPFISGSDAYYIGRTHVMNADAVGKEPIAEVFVHEAIHSVLYMIEEHRNWMPGEEDARRIGINVPSNWSGNKLSVRSYFQAIFVWFGIWNLWQHARREGLYDQGWVEKRLVYVTNGFATLDLDKVKATFGISIPEETADAIMQAKRIVMQG